MRANVLKIALAALAALGITTVFAHAADKGGAPISSNVFADAPVGKISWTGIYLGVGVGYGAANGEISSGGTSFIDGLSATGIVYNVEAGADVQIPGSMVVIGARGSYGDSREQFSVFGGAFKAGLDTSWAADARLGLAMGTALPYVFAGYTKAHTQTNVAGFSSPDLKGWRTGAGVEFRLPKLSGNMFNTSLGLEYIYTSYDDVNLGGSPIILSVTDQTAMAKLRFRFGEGYSNSR